MNLKFLFLLLIFPIFGWGQVTISGKVTAKSDGFPLSGVIVLEKDTQNGTTTDFDGNFTLTVADKKSILQFLYVGMIVQEVRIKDQTQILIELEEDCSIHWFDGNQIGLYLNSGVLHTPIGGQLDVTFPSFLPGPLLKSGISYQTDLKDNRFINANLNLEHLFVSCGFNADISSSFRRLDFDNTLTLEAYSIETSLNFNEITTIIGYNTIEFVNQNKLVESSGLTLGLGTFFNSRLFDSASAKATVYNGLVEYHATLKMRYKRLYSFLKFYKVNSFNEVSIGIGTKLWY